MTYKPPLYCPNAIATDTGWVNPKTGELLVAIRHLDTKIRESTKGDVEQVRELDAKVNIVPPVIEVLTVEEEPVKLRDHVLTVEESINVDEQFPGTKRPGRPKKQKEIKNEQV